MVMERLEALYISTHALREEGDDKARPRVEIEITISTHALREEGDRWSSAHWRAES